MRTTIASLLLTATALTLAATAHAESRLEMGAGVFDIRHKDRSPLVALEWHGNALYNNFAPIIGGAVDTDKGSYLYGGVAYDYAINDTWTLTPSFAAGAYHIGDSRDLGGVLEFRSSISAQYKLENETSLGVKLYHISNAGYYARNPGTEALLVTWSIPMRFFYEDNAR